VRLCATSFFAQAPDPPIRSSFYWLPSSLWHRANVFPLFLFPYVPSIDTFVMRARTSFLDASENPSWWLPGRAYTGSFGVSFILETTLKSFLRYSHISFQPLYFIAYYSQGDENENKTVGYLV
jgi:hypothetical protein